MEVLKVIKLHFALKPNLGLETDFTRPEKIFALD